MSGYWRTAGYAAQEPTKVIFHFYRLDDRYRELDWLNDCYGATRANVWIWSTAGEVTDEVVATLPTTKIQMLMSALKAVQKVVG